METFETLLGIAIVRCYLVQMSWQMRANTICEISLLCIIIISCELTATTTPKMFNVNCIAIKAPRLIGVLVSADQTGTMAFLYVIHHQYIIET